MAFKTLFSNNTERLAASGRSESITEILSTARASRSRNWEIPILCLNSHASINLSPGKQHEIIADDEFGCYAQYESVSLDPSFDENGQFVPKVNVVERKGWVEPAWQELNIIMFNDDMSSLNAPPCYWSQAFVVDCPAGIPIVLPCPYDLAVAKFSSLSYQGISFERVYDPRVSDNYRTVSRGGGFIGTLRTKDEIATIKKILQKRRLENTFGVTVVNPKEE